MPLENREEYDVDVPGSVVDMGTGLYLSTGGGRLVLSIEYADQPGRYLAIEADVERARQVAATIYELADELEQEAR